MIFYIPTYVGISGALRPRPGIGIPFYWEVSKGKPREAESRRVVLRAGRRLTWGVSVQWL